MQWFQVEVYPMGLPENSSNVYEREILAEVVKVCRYLHHEESSPLSFSDKEVMTYFQEYQDISSFRKHLVLTVDPSFDWEGMLQHLMQHFPHMAWVKVGFTCTRQMAQYFFEFVPLAYQSVGFPFLINLPLSLNYCYGENSDNEAVFVEEVQHLLASLVETQETRRSEKKQVKSEKEEKIKVSRLRKKEPKKEVVSVNLDETVRSEELDNLPYEITILRQECLNEKNAKARMNLLNQKLELLMAQMEHYQLKQAMNTLNNPKSPEEEDWSKIHKISFREYMILMQKAKFLEQIWLLNRDLVTQTEKMTISNHELTYEREQVKRLKENLSSSEIYLVLDECQGIEQRIKVKKGMFFRKPHVRIMGMDYENLQNKARYFELLQGENAVLEHFYQKEIQSV